MRTHPLLAASVLGRAASPKAPDACAQFGGIGASIYGDGSAIACVLREEVRQVRWTVLRQSKRRQGSLLHRDDQSVLRPCTQHQIVRRRLEDAQSCWADALRGSSARDS